MSTSVQVASGDELDGTGIDPCHPTATAPADSVHTPASRDRYRYESEGLKGLDLTIHSEPSSDSSQSARGVRGQQSKETHPPRLARNLGALAGGQLVTWTMTLIWTLIVPRALGPEGLGIVVSAQSVAGVLGIVLGLGTRQYLVREMVVTPDEGPKLVGTAIVLRVILAPLVALGAVLWAHFAHYSHEATIVLYLITGMTLLTLLAEPLQAAFQATEQMTYLAYGDVINKTGQSLIGIALVIVGFRTVGIATNMAVMAGAVGLISYFWLRRFLRIDMRTNVPRMASMAKESFAYWAFGLFGFFYLWIDTIMLSLMTRSEVVGWYGASTQIFQTLMFLPALVTTAWLPRLVGAFVRGRKELVETARTPVEFILVVSVPVAAGTALVAPILIHVVYGPAFAHAIPVMVILAFCIPPIYLNILLANVLLAAKRQAVWTVVMAAAAVLNPLLNLVLIPVTEHAYHNGAIGAAISLVLTELLMDIVGLVLVGRHVFARSSVRRCGLAIVASAGMWAAAVATRPFGTLISLAAAAIALIGMTIALRIASDDEVAAIKAAFARLKGRRFAGAGPKENTS
jgi:O-antigen/teichoic acid export membrane protein